MAGQLKRFTEEQIDRANRVDVVEYARSQGIVIKQSGLWYKAQNMGGLYFHRGANTWHWETQDAGGKGSISLCMKLENKTWVEAVKTLLGEEMEPIRHTWDWKPEPEPPKEFRLPDKNDTYRHIFAYLTKSRGIDPGILKEMVDKGYVYENTQKSCVFVGRDKDGTAKHASVRSTNTYGKTFKQDVPGSQKAFSFSISGTSGTLNVFEAPIDALSYMSLQKVYGKQVNDSYVALGGVTDKALERFLKDHPDIEKIRVCTDNDPAGEKAASRFFESYKEKYKVTRHRPTNKDFNEDLVAYRAKDRRKDEKEVQEEQTSIEEHENTAREQKQPDVQQEQENVPEEFSIKGTCEILVLCDDKEEIQAYRDISVRNYKAEFNIDYEPDEYYLAYKDTGQVQSFIERNPDIKKLWVCTGRNAEGAKKAEDILQSFGQKMECHREKPRLNRFSEDLAKMNCLESTLGQSPLEEMHQMEATVGMEM